jgi:hypothetical protein
MSKFQRDGVQSNAHAGRAFEILSKQYLEKIFRITLGERISLDIGHNIKKRHFFDLGKTGHDNLIIECKSHRWTKGNNVPSAKLTTWNEAMHYFFLANAKYKKIFFIEKAFNSKLQTTLGKYYIKQYGHMIPKGVEIWEYDIILKKHSILYPALL